MRKSKDSLELVEGENNNLLVEIIKITQDRKDLKKALAETKLEINHLKQLQKIIKENDKCTILDVDNSYSLLESKYNLLVSNFGKLEAIHKSCVQKNECLLDNEKVYLLEIEEQKKKLEDCGSEIIHLKFALKEEKENYDYCLNNLKCLEIENLNFKKSLKNPGVVKFDKLIISNFPVITYLPVIHTKESLSEEEVNISNDYSLELSEADHLIHSLSYSLNALEKNYKSNNCDKVKYEQALDVLESIFPYLFLFVFVFVFSQRFLFPVAA